MTLLLLVLAAYRVTRLVVRDTFPPVLAVRDRLAGGWRPMTQPELDTLTAGRHGEVTGPYVREDDGVKVRYLRRSAWSPYWLAELVSCAWCASGWVSGALVAATDLVSSVPSPWLTGAAVWAGSALLASRSWA